VAADIARSACHEYLRHVFLFKAFAIGDIADEPLAIAT
jgi:hypothetical protein